MISLYRTNLVLCEGPSELLPVEGVLAGDAEALLRRAQHAPRDPVSCIVQATIERVETVHSYVLSKLNSKFFN